MSVNLDRLSGDEPPDSPAPALAAKVSQLLLLILCVSPIAIFPIALAVRAFQHYFP